MLSSCHYHIYGDLLIRKVGINSYIYVNNQDQYKKHHIIYNITNELLTDYIANILNLQITGKQISSDQRCFFELSFDDYINRQLEKKHFNQEDVIQAYFENDISFFEDVFNNHLSYFEGKCYIAFRHHQQLN